MSIKTTLIHINKDIKSIIDKIRFTHVLDRSDVIQVLSKLLANEAASQNISNACIFEPYLSTETTEEAQIVALKKSSIAQELKVSIQKLSDIENIEGTELQRIYLERIKEETEKLNQSTITGEILSEALFINDKLTKSNLAYIFTVPKKEVLKVMRESGIATFESKSRQIEERLTLVEQLVKKTTKSCNEIASIIGVNASAVRNDIDFLKKQERIDSDFSFSSKQIGERLIEVEQLIQKPTLSRNEMAELLGVTAPTIGKDIEALKKQGRIDKNFSFSSNEATSEKLEKLATLEQLIKNTRLNKSEIIEKMGFSDTTIKKYVNILKGEGKIGEKFKFGRNRMLY